MSRLKARAAAAYGRFGNVGFLIASAYGNAALAFVIQVVLARSLGPGDFGAIMVAMSITAIMGALAAFGIPSFATRAHGHGPEEYALSIGRILKLFALTSLLSAVAIILVGTVIEPTKGVLTMILIGNTLGLAGSELAIIDRQLRGQHSRVALLQFLPNLFRLAALGIALIWTGGAIDVRLAALCISGAGLIYALVGLASARSLLALAAPVSPAKPATGWRSILKQTSTLFAVGFGYLLYSQVALSLSSIAGDHEASYYGVASSLITAACLLPTAIYARYLLPRIYVWIYHDKSALRRLYTQGSAWLALAGVAAFGGCLTLGMFVLEAVFGPAFRPAWTPLVILGMSLPLRFVSIGLSYILQGQRTILWQVGVLIVGVLCNIGFCLLLVPRYGASGAAMAMLATEALVATGYFWAVRSLIFSAGSERAEDVGPSPTSPEIAAERFRV